MQHTFAALVENTPGVLNRIVSLFRRRQFNIDSLTVGPTHRPGISRITIVVDSEKADIERVLPYMYKLVNVISVEDLTEKNRVSRDLAVIKVRWADENRAALMQFVEVFRAHIVDVCVDSMIVEITGDESKISSFLDLLKPYGIIEMVRTGIVSMERGSGALYYKSYTPEDFLTPIPAEIDHSGG